MVPSGDSRPGDDLDDPPLTITNMRTVVLDTEGRLVEFHAVPPQLESERRRDRASRRTGARCSIWPA